VEVAEITCKSGAGAKRGRGGDRRTELSVFDFPPLVHV